jgi:hypothetical protein
MLDAHPDASISIPRIELPQHIAQLRYVLLREYGTDIDVARDQ